MIDAIKLHSLYSKKRESFTSNIDNITDEGLKGKVFHAALMTDLCMFTFDAFAANLTKMTDYMKKELHQSLESQNEIINLIKESREMAKSISIAELKESNELMIQFIVKNSSYQFNNAELLFEARYAMMDLSIVLLLESLSNLFESDDSEIIKAVLLKLLLNIIGLIPGGIIITILNDIKDVANYKRDQIHVVNNYLNEINSFNILALNWCIATQLLIDVIDNLESSEIKTQEIIYEAAHEKVKERFMKIVENLKAT